VRAEVESRWQLDVERTSIVFESRWLFGMATTTGTLEAASGWAVLRANGELLGEIAAGTAGISTGNRLRDRHLQNRLFFDARRHPTIVFSSRVCTVGNGRFDGMGVLSARGRTAKVRVSGIVERDTQRMRLAGATALDTRDFGLPSACGYIRRDVTVSVDARLSREICATA
jgi:polyisoprenoid-binding protein YceI